MPRKQRRDKAGGEGEGRLPLDLARNGMSGGPCPGPDRGDWLARASREELASVLENASCGIAVMENIRGRTVYINPACFEITGYDLREVYTKQMAKRVMFSGDKTGRSEARHLEAMLKSGQSPFLQRIRRKDGRLAVCEVRNVVLSDGTVVGAWTDVTRRENAEEELKHREAQFRLFFEESFDAALLFEKNAVIDCNQAALGMLKCSDKASLIGRSLWDLSSRDSQDGRISERRAEQVMRSAMGKKLRLEWALKRIDGEAFPAEVTVTATRLDGKEILYVVVRDIDDLKKTERALLAARQELSNRVRERTSALTRANRELQERTGQLTEVNRKLKESREELRHLYEHVNRAREEERTRLAREVHDELGHFLMGLKMDLAYMKKGQEDGSGDLRKQTTAIEQKIDHALGVVGQICSDLRPHVLDQLGLPSAVEWHVNRFRKKTGIDCVSEISEEIPPVKKEQAIVLFRVLQEAMSNILRHSGATAARISLGCQGGSLVLCVADNGRGITREELADPQSFGIIGIRERVRFWGGKSGFEGVKGKGTTVTISIPLDRLGEGSTGKGKRGI